MQPYPSGRRTLCAWRGIFSLIFGFLVLSQLNCRLFESTGRPEGADPESPLKLNEAENAYKKEYVLPRFESGENPAIRINRIFIFNRPISEMEGVIPKVVNFIHWTTEKSVIRAELLFYENSETTFADIVESEIILRTLSSIKEARIFIRPSSKEGEYDAYVYTADRVTSTVNWSLRASGGYTRFYASAGDRNFFGRLYELSANYERENFIDTPGINTGQSRLFGTPLSLSVQLRESFITGTRNYSSQAVFLQKEFRSYSEHFAFYSSYIRGNGVRYRFAGSRIEKVEDNGTIYQMVLGRDREEWNAEGWYAIGKFTRAEIGAGFGQKKDVHFLIPEKEQYSVNPSALSGVSETTETNLLPVKEDGRFVFAGLNLASVELLTRKNFQLFEFTEDILRGLSLKNGFRYASPDFGLRDHYSEIESQLDWIHDRNGFRNHVILAREGRFRHNISHIWLNDFTTAENRSYLFFSWGTLAWRTSFKQGTNLDRDHKFIQGGDYLRGFALRSYLGNFAYLTSLEYRTLPKRLWYGMIGAVIFLDFGEVKGGIPNQWNQLSPEPIVGFGLRSSLVEFDKNLFRIDIGFPLKSDSFDLLNQLNFGLMHSF